MARPKHLRSPIPQRKLGVAWVLGLIGLLTVASGSAVLLNFAGAGNQAGHVVPLVLWMSILSGALYIAGAIGLYQQRTWAPFPLLLALALLAVAAIGFFLHVRRGLPYEPRTVVALSFRIFVTALFHRAVRHFSKHQPPYDQPA
ncbi:MAG: hypothetical protein KBH07_02750 [Flavobacteriales bacterium]|nr:hypothetical protein [Flavobacteriales bacterium]MBP9079267.1 hypothetical protein [Flavobacteriales bacterium]